MTGKKINLKYEDDSFFNNPMTHTGYKESEIIDFNCGMTESYRGGESVWLFAIVMTVKALVLPSKWAYKNIYFYMSDGRNNMLERLINVLIDKPVEEINLEQFISKRLYIYFTNDYYDFCYRYFNEVICINFKKMEEEL